MANVTITVGALSSQRTADNTKASNIFNLVIAAQGGPVNGTNQEKLDWITGYITRHFVEVAHGQTRRQERQTADTNADTINAGNTWT